MDKISKVEKQSAVVCKNQYFPVDENMEQENGDSHSEIMDSVLVQNLLSYVTRLDLIEVFQEMGALVSVDIHVDATGFGIGSAIVKFQDPKYAAVAVRELNHEHLDKQPMNMMLINDKIAAEFYKQMDMHY